MKAFRDVIKEVIISLQMLPVMYEYWPQSDMRPSSECCLKVLESDIFLCILGYRYGSIDKYLDISMTEIEYRTALAQKKPILVYIINPSNETDEPDEKSRRQKELIEEISENRIRKIFSDSNSLANQATRDLMEIRKNY